MDKIFLIKPSLKYKIEYEEMMDEWEKYGGRIHPGALVRYSNKQKKNVTFEEWLKWIEEDKKEETCPSGAVPQDLFFLINKNDRILGAITIRHYLNKKMEINGGHLGVGVRPSERLKGYATKMIQLAMPIVKNEYGINKIMYTCDKENIGSVKAIKNNGGTFLDEIIDENGNKIHRFTVEI